MAPLPIVGRTPVTARLIAPPQALVELASLIRRRLHSTVRDTVRAGVRAGVRGIARADRSPAPATAPVEPDTVIVAAAAQFAPNAYARARLLRQMHACGLLSQQETEQVEHMLGVAN